MAVVSQTPVVWNWYNDSVLETRDSDLFMFADLFWLHFEASLLVFTFSTCSRSTSDKHLTQ